MQQVFDLPLNSKRFETSQRGKYFTFDGLFLVLKNLVKGFELVAEVGNRRLTFVNSPCWKLRGVC